MTAKDLKIIIIGFGSIGHRHYRNLAALGYKNVFVYDVDKNKIKDQRSKIKSLDKATLSNFDVAFICNPNHKHIEVAIKCAEARLHLFVEKPLSNNLKNVSKLENLCRKNHLVNMVACNMRFHPAFQSIKKFMDAGKFGKIFSSSHEFGHYLPYWRPGTDYRKNYAAKKKMGGGIVLDDIHEFDLLFWLNDFSPVTKSCLLKNNSGALDIETEDQAKAVFRFKNGVSGSVSCDYLSKKYHRTCRIVGEKGNLTWNWQDNEVIFENEKTKKVIYSEKNLDINQMYLAEAKYFLDSVKKKKKTFNEISRAREVLRHLI